MNRISAFSVPSAFAASLLLAACAPDSLTSSDSSRVQSLADSAARDSLAGRGPREGSGGVAVTTGTGAVADEAVPGAVADEAVPGAVTDATSGTPADTTSGGESVATSGDVAVTTPGAAEDTAGPGAVEDTANVVVAVPADTGAGPGAIEDGSQGDAAAAAAVKALEGSWKRSGHLIEPGITLDGVLVTDLLTQDAIESRDNLTRFQAGGVWTEDEGPLKSVPASMQSEDGAWSLNAAGDVLSLHPAGAANGGDHFDFKVLELSSTTLKVATFSSDYADGRSHTETITFTRI